MNTINSLGSIGLQITQPSEISEVSKATSDFGKVLQTTIDKVNETQTKGDAAIQKLQTGDAKHLHEVMIAVEEADISLRMLVQMRNKAMTAYEEIMRMQI